MELFVFFRHTIEREQVSVQLCDLYPRSSFKHSNFPHKIESIKFVLTCNVFIVILSIRLQIFATYIWVNLVAIILIPLSFQIFFAMNITCVIWKKKMVKIKEWNQLKDVIGRMEQKKKNSHILRLCLIFPENIKPFKSREKERKKKHQLSTKYVKLSNYLVCCAVKKAYPSSTYRLIALKLLHTNLLKQEWKRDKQKEIIWWSKKSSCVAYSCRLCMKLSSHSKQSTNRKRQRKRLRVSGGKKMANNCERAHHVKCRRRYFMSISYDPQMV